MNFESFVAKDGNFRRAGSLLIKAIENQKTKPDDKDCTSLLTDVLYEPSNSYKGKTFIEARMTGGDFCGLAIYTLQPDYIFVDLLCSDCPGTGRLFIGEFVRIAREAGKPFVRLFSIKEAIGFYTKMGFAQVGDPVESGTVLMELPVRPSGGPAAAGASGGRRKTYRRRHNRRHGSTSVRRYKTRRVLSR